MAWTTTESIVRFLAGTSGVSLLKNVPVGSGAHRGTVYFSYWLCAITQHLESLPQFVSMLATRLASFILFEFPMMTEKFVYEV